MGFSEGNILSVVAGIKKGYDEGDIDGAVLGTIVGANVGANDVGLRKNSSANSKIDKTYGYTTTLRV